MRRVTQADMVRIQQGRRLEAMAAVCGRTIRMAGMGVGPAGLEPFCLVNGKPMTVREATADLEWRSEAAIEMSRALEGVGL